jgi:hypothetical protein
MSEPSPKEELLAEVRDLMRGGEYNRFDALLALEVLLVAPNAWSLGEPVLREALSILRGER